MGDGSRLVTVTCLQHHQTLVSGLWNFFTAKYGVNCDVSVDGRTIKAHRLVAEVFLSPNKLSSIDPTQISVDAGPKIEQNEWYDDRQDNDGSHLDSMLEFLYTGRTTVREAQLSRLLDAARDVDFRLLVDAVEDVKIDVDVKIEDALESFENDDMSKNVKIEVASECFGIGDATESFVSDIASENIKIEVVSECFDIKGALESGVNVEEIAPATDPSDRPSDGFSDSSKENGSKVAGLVNGPIDGGTVSSNNTTRRLSQRQRKMPAKFLSAELDFPVESEWPTPAKKRVKLVLPKREPVVCSNEAVDRLALFSQTYAIDDDNGANGTDRDRTVVSERRDQPAPVVPHRQAVPHKYKCDRCNFRSNRENIYRIHMANHDPNAQVFHCPWCTKMFLSQVSLQGHRCVKTTTTRKKYACSQCDFWNRDKAVYRVHLKTEHGIDVGPVFMCEECGKPFLSLQSLERHLAEKHGITPVDNFRCPHCKYETQKVWSYNHHLFTEHHINAKGDVLPRVKCGLCELTCKTQQDLRAHVLLWHQVQEGEIKRSVNVVSETPPPQHPQPQQIKVDVADRSNMCGLCGYSAATSHAELEEHKLSHVGSKTHRCDVCGRMLSDRNTLRRHVLTHMTGAKSHGCPVCSYASNRRDNLRSHLRNVHKINSYTPS